MHMLIEREEKGLKVAFERVERERLLCLRWAASSIGWRKKSTSTVYSQSDTSEVQVTAVSCLRRGMPETGWQRVDRYPEPCCAYTRGAFSIAKFSLL